MPKKGSKWTRPPRTRTVPTETEPGQISARQARREEARRQREALRRKQRRRRRYALVAGIGGTVALVGGLVVFFVINAQNQAKKEEAARQALARQERRLLAQAPDAAQAVSCTAVKNTVRYQGGSDHVHVTQIPPISSYPTQPPASGPHNPVPLDAGVYSSPPDLGQAIHSLEHAAVEIWYSPSASESGLAPIKDFFSQDEEQFKVIVAPYSYPDQGGRLPDSYQMALVAWHRVRHCEQPSLPVAFAFVRDYRADPAHPAAYKGVAREPLSPI